MKYSTEKTVFYPNVVTLSQIYSMMCQRYIEDGVTKEIHPQEEMTEIDPMVVRKSLDTAVGRASLRHSNTNPPTRKDLLVSIATTSKASGKELLKRLHSGLKILGQHYSRCDSLLSLVVYRGIFILFLMVDMFFTAINILGFYSYRYK